MTVPPPPMTSYPAATPAENSRRSSLWLGISIGAAVMLVVGGLVVGVFVAFFYMWGIGGSYHDGSLSDLEVSDETYAACDDMYRIGDDIPLFAGPEESAARLHEYADSVDRIATTLDKSNEDHARWRRQLDRFAERVHEYADAVADDPTTPADWSTGRIVERLWELAPYDCAIPWRIESLDPDYR